MAVAPTVMSELRTKDNLIYTFKKIGYNLDDVIYDAIFNLAAHGNSMASVNSFRDALNDYLDAVETDNEHIWCARNRVPYNR